MYETSVRAIVSKVNRRINIQGQNDFHLRFKGYRTEDQRLRSGGGVLQGVRLINGGQRNTRFGTVLIENTITSTITITQSAIENCTNGCIDVKNLNIVNIQYNLLFNAEKFHIRISDAQGNFTAENNVLVGVSKSKTLLPEQKELVACIIAYDYIFKENVKVNSNNCHGSEGIGFVLPMLSYNVSIDILANYI